MCHRNSEILMWLQLSVRNKGIMVCRANSVMAT